MAEATPPVAIIMGSQSDWTVLKQTADTLDALGIAHDDRIISAHRTPDRMVTFAKGARDDATLLLTEDCTTPPQREFAALCTAESIRAGRTFFEEWGLFAGVSGLKVKSKVVASGTTVLQTTVDFRPIVYSAGVSYRF